MYTLGKEIQIKQYSDCHVGKHVRIIAIFLLLSVLLSACAAMDKTTSGIERRGMLASSLDTSEEEEISAIRNLLSKALSRGEIPAKGADAEYDPLTAIDSFDYLDYWLTADADFENVSDWGAAHAYKLLWSLKASGLDFSKAADILMEDEEYCRFLLYVILTYGQGEKGMRQEEWQSFLSILLNLRESEQWNTVVRDYMENNRTVGELYASLNKPEKVCGIDMLIGISVLELPVGRIFIIPIIH